MVSDTKRQFYATIAERFDGIMNGYDLQRRLEIVYGEFLPGDLSGCQLLDVGSGTGWFSKRAVERGATVTSLDIGESLLRQTLSKASVRPVVGDTLALPFRRACFDIVVSSEVIEHTTNPEVAVSEMARVLRPGGVLALTCPNHLWQWSVALLNRLGARPYRGYENFPGYFQLRKVMCRTGLRVVKHYGLHLWPFQARWFNSLSGHVDVAWGKGPLGAVMINQAILGMKPQPVQERGRPDEMV